MHQCMIELLLDFDAFSSHQLLHQMMAFESQKVNVYVSLDSLRTSQLAYFCNSFRQTTTFYYQCVQSISFLNYIEWYIHQTF